MRVGIGLLTLVPGVVGGSETYCRELCRALARHRTLDYRVLCSRLAAGAGGGLPETVAGSYRASTSTAGRLLAMADTLARSRRLGRELGLAELDAVHYPLTIATPPTRRPPTVVTVHDLQHRLHPGFFSTAERAWRRATWERSIRRSAIAIAISGHVRDTIVDLLGVPTDRIRVVHHGIDHIRFSPAPVEREPFLLYPANRWPHKNHDRLLEAFALVRAKRPELRLVLTGRGHEAVRADGVEALGLVSPDRLVDLYRRASALVFPSLFEGFGQPPLEAMACGCPVACSTAASLPEIVGDAAALFDPTSVEAIADGIEQALMRGPELRELGLGRAAGFTWDASARGHEAAYRDATG